MTVLDPSMIGRPVRAAAYAIIGMGMIGAADNVMPEVARHIGIAQFHFTRSAMALALVPLAFAVAGVRFRIVNIWGVIGRSSLLTLGMVIYFACVGFLPVAQVLAGVFTAPLWIMLATRLEGGRIEPVGGALIFLGFLGCLAVVQPQPGAMGWLALGPLLAGFFYGMGGKVTRRWTAEEDPWVLVATYLAMIGALGGLALLVFDPAHDDYLTRGWAPMPAHVVFYCALQAAVALVAVALLTKAYQIAAPAFVGAFEYTVLIVAAGVGYLAWGHGLNGLSAIGIAMILASGAALAWWGDRA
ncbi:MAG: DMT family transporter [Pseudomonadota bacterium]